jgi:outer membrane protein
MKKSLTLCLMLSVLLIGMGDVRAEFKVAYVDMNRAMNECEQGQVELKRLEAEFKVKQENAQKEAEELQAKVERLRRQEETMRGPEKRRIEEQLQKEYIELQQKMRALQGELQEALAGATMKIKRRMDRILGEQAQKEGYNLILDLQGGGVIYFEQALDLTNLLIREYNKRYPVEGQAASEGRRREQPRQNRGPRRNNSRQRDNN